MSEIFSIIQREAIYLWYYFDIQLRQILPYWAAGIVIGSIISVFGKDKIHKLLTVIQDKHLGHSGNYPICAFGYRLAALYVRHNSYSRVIFTKGIARRLSRGVYDVQCAFKSAAFNLQCRSRFYRTHNTLCFVFPVRHYGGCAYSGVLQGQEIFQLHEIR